MTLDISDRRFFSFTAEPPNPHFGDVAYNIQIQKEEEVVEEDDDDPPATAGCGMLEMFRQCCSHSPPRAQPQPAITNRVLTWYNVSKKERQSLLLSSCQVHRDNTTYEVTARDQKIRLIFNLITDASMVKAYRSELPAEEM